MLGDPILHVILPTAWRRFGLRWEAAGGQAALGDYYLAVMDAVYPLCTTCLFMVEGTGAAVFKANWGALGFWSVCACAWRSKAGSLQCQFNAP